MTNLTLQEQLKALSPELFNTKEERCENKFENKIYNKEVNETQDKIVHNNNIINKDVVMRISIKNEQVNKPQRREIWMVNFGQRKGSLQSGIRPCIISSNFVNNQFASIRNVFPITSKINKKLPVHVELDESCGLKEKSLVLTEQVTTIDIRYDLLYYIGIVDEVTMKRIDKARDIQLGGLEEKTLLEKLPSDMKSYIINKIKFIETCKQSIEFLQKINGDQYSIDLAEDEKFKEENALQYFCYNNKISYDEIYNNYIEIEKRKEEVIAL